MKFYAVHKVCATSLTLSEMWQSVLFQRQHSREGWKVHLSFSKVLKFAPFGCGALQFNSKSSGLICINLHNKPAEQNSSQQKLLHDAIPGDEACCIPCTLQSYATKFETIAVLLLACNMHD